MSSFILLFNESMLKVYAQGFSDITLNVHTFFGNTTYPNIALGLLYKSNTRL